MATSRAALFLALAVAPSAPGQDIPHGGAPESRSSRQLLLELRSEASRVDMTKSSKLMADLADVRVANRLGLSKEQREHVRRLDGLACDIIRAWLLRDLDKSPPPSATILAERLSDRGAALRTRLISHAESLALEGILTPEQSRRWRALRGWRARTLSPGRDGVRSNRTVDDGMSAEYLAAELECMADYHRSAGSVLAIVVGTMTSPPRLMIRKEQADLARRLDALTVEIIRSWLTGDLDPKRRPPWPLLAERFSWGDMVVDSLCAHAEAVALEGILTPEQSEKTRALIWRASGLFSLRHPDLVSRLRLSEAQREALAVLLDRRGKLPVELGYRLSHIPADLPGGAPMPNEQIKMLIENQTSIVEDEIWDVLTPSQATILRRIFDAAEPRRDEAREEVRPRGGAVRRGTRSGAKK